jgi:hypothetical protein
VCHWIVLALLLTACTGKEQPRPASYTTGTTTINGLASTEIAVEGGVSSFLVTATALNDDALLAVESIERPSGSTALDWMDWYYSPNYLTASILPVADNVVLNWPVRHEDPALTGGDWTVNMVAVSEAGVYLDGVELSVTVQTKADVDLREGTVKVLIAYAEGVGDMPDVVEAVELGVEEWRSLWFREGIYLQERYIDSDFDPQMPFVGDGHRDFESLAQSSDDDELVMVIGQSIGGAQDYYGVSGNIPGSLIATPRSAVQLSWLANTGLDGDFSDTDIQLMGETMAHEMGHYMGLFHPVEIGFQYWDALGDTAECGNQSSCESSLSENLMYPYPVCSLSDCVAQQDITGGQAGVLHLYTGTL